MKTVEEIKIGDVFARCFGYDSQFVEFYQVVRKSPKSVFVKLMDTERNYENIMEWEETPTTIIEAEPEHRLSILSWCYKLMGEVVYPFKGGSVSCYNYH